MNCQEALDKLYQLIDQESSDIEENTIREHLSRCCNCSDIYKLEQAVNDFVLARVRKNSEPVKLTNLKTRILEEMDSVDCADDKHDPDTNIN